MALKWWRAFKLAWFVLPAPNRSRRQRLQCFLFRPVLEELEARFALDDVSAGPAGINARYLGPPDTVILNGSGVGIGQVEPVRPGKPGFDNAANSHPDVTPTAVFLRNGPAVANANTHNHAESVAGVMIANGPSDKGVSYEASLFASAYNVPALPGQHEAAISAQHVALQNGGDVRAINFSFGEQLVGGAVLDGNSLLTQFVDWSARTHDVLYVVAGNEGPNGVPGPIPVPTDEYNGVTVAFSKLADGVFRQVDSFNDNPNAPPDQDAVGPRRSVDLLAPGRDINMPRLGGGPYVPDFGTSFAAPHVTGTVALLQQYGNERAIACQNWAQYLYKQHEVMKAVLMNSADKIKDNGDHKRLDMERDVLNRNGQIAWFVSDARDANDNQQGRDIPLDAEMGTGHLNAKRAWTQFRAGEHGPGIVPPIGWDYHEAAGAGVTDYTFDRPLVGGSYVSITLVWDRLVQNVGGDPGVYELGDTFSVTPLVNLDLHLNATQSGGIWTSWSGFDNVEHIFYQLPPGDAEYWFRVVHSGAQKYAVAWWTYPTIPPQPV